VTEAPTIPVGLSGAGVELDHRHRLAHHPAEPGLRYTGAFISHRIAPPGGLRRIGSGSGRSPDPVDMGPICGRNAGNNG
jgi:hypothetical protein